MEIVAECGVNWRTKEEAFEMVKQCKVCGISHAKFQIFNEETIKDSPLKEQLIPLILTSQLPRPEGRGLPAQDGQLRADYTT